MLANVSVDYFRLISRNGNSALIHVLNYCTYVSPLNLNIFVKKKKKHVKKIRQFSGTNISRSAEAISFNFDM